MEKEFIGYTEALALKELGFDKPCLAWFDVIDYELFIEENEYTKSNQEIVVLAPLYQQAFRWFREKYSYHHSIYYHKSSKFECRVVDSSDNNLSDDLFNDMYLTYEESEFECLKKLIEIVKKGSV